jgi:outer membrane receptor protein involved in Fe transport
MFLVTGSVYYNLVSNFISEVDNTPSNPYNGFTTGIHFENSDKEVIIYGYELNFTSKLNDHFSLYGNVSGSYNYGSAPLRELDANGDYQTIVDGNGSAIIDDNVLIGDMAPVKFNLGLLYNYKGLVSFYPKLNYVSSKKTINWQQNPSTNPIVRDIDGYGIVGLNINVLNMFGKVKGLDLNLKFDNLLNSEYYNSGSRSANGTKYNARVLQPEFNFMAGLSWSL